MPLNKETNQPTNINSELKKKKLVDFIVTLSWVIISTHVKSSAIINEKLLERLAHILF